MNFEKQTEYPLGYDLIFKIDTSTYFFNFYAPIRSLRNEHWILSVTWYYTAVYVESEKTSPQNISASNCRIMSRQFQLPYARHYNPRFVYFLAHFWFSLRFILQTIYVLKMEILHFLSLKSAVYTRERLLIKSGLQWRVYGTCTMWKMNF